MINKEDKSLFEILNKIDVNKHKKKKGQFDYLSWPLAVQELLKVCPDAEWEVHEYPNEDGLTAPYMTTSAGCFVKVSLTCEGITRTQVHPVTDHRNQTIAQPNSQEINTSIQRCLAKVIALHGLGLYIFAGEDLPEPDALNNEEKKKVLDEAKGMGKSFINDLKTQIENQTINLSNYKKCIARIKEMKKENGGKK